MGIRGVLVGALAMLGCGSTAASTDAGSDARPGFDASQACGLQQYQLASQLLAPNEGRPACSVVVRISATTMRPTGFQAFCGAATGATDAQAAALAEAAMIPSATPQRVEAATPADAFLFYAPPSDLGGIVAVSARLGVTVFAAPVVWGNPEQTFVPAQWRDGSELAYGCGTGVVIPRVRGVNLSSGAALDAATIEPVTDAIRRTMLPGALADRGAVLDAVVFGYDPTPGRDGDGDDGPLWIAIVNAGRDDPTP